MQALGFDELFAFLYTAPLSSIGLARLREWLDSIRDPAECLALIEAAAAGRPCPHCACPRLRRSGFASGLQRYRCLYCRRSFNALTGTALARLRKPAGGARPKWCDAGFSYGARPRDGAQLRACLQPMLPGPMSGLPATLALRMSP